jgi:prepilin-type N-terminal cleavage/methylation domain-containing protein
MSNLELPKVRGFSLLEILIVLWILAFLYTLALGNITNMQNTAKISKANGDLQALKLALNYYVQTKNKCPEENDFQRTIMKETPGMLYTDLIDPFAENGASPYKYSISPNKENYVVYSIGPSHKGSATIGDNGVVQVVGAAIVATNGYM